MCISQMCKLNHIPSIKASEECFIIIYLFFSFILFSIDVSFSC